MRDDIKKRIEAVRRGEVPEGYVSENHQLRPCDWRYEKIGKYLVSYDEYSNDTEQYELATSSRQGLMLQTDYYSDQRFDETAGGFHVVPEGYITYRHMSDDDIFKFNVNQLGVPVLVSPEYPVFTTSDELRQDLLLEYLNDSAEFRAFCRAQKKGSTRTRMYFSRLGEFSMPIPPKAEQQKIAEILSACDRVIELKQRLVEELQQLKKTCLAKMFPQKGCTIPEIRFPECDGPWVQHSLSEITTKIGSGKTPSGGKASYVESGIVLIRSQNVYADEVDLSEVVFIDAQTDSSMANSRVVSGDVLLNITGASIGRSAVYKDSHPANVNQHVCIVRPAKEYDPRFIQLNLSSANGQKQIAAGQAGGGREGLNFQQIGKMNFRFPEEKEQRKIGLFFDKIDGLISLHQRELEEAQQKKKSLMQLLLTGMVRASE